MNIIDAMKAAENGKLITNGFLKSWDNVLKYMGKGLFYQYEIRGGLAFYRFEVREFTFAYILSIDWEIVEGVKFPKDSN